MKDDPKSPSFDTRAFFRHERLPLDKLHVCRMKQGEEEFPALAFFPAMILHKTTITRLLMSLLITKIF